MNLLKFELKKTWYGKRFHLLLLIVLISICGVFYSNTLMKEEISKRAWEELYPNIETASMLRQDYDKKVAEVGMTDRIQEGYDNMLAMNQAMIDWEIAINEHDWEAIPSIKLRFLHTIAQQNSYGFKYGEYEEEDLTREIEKNQILVNRGLPYEDTFYSLSSFNFMKQAASLFLSIYGILLFILLFGDHYIAEIEQQTIRTLYTQPLRRWSILVNKLAGIMVAVVLGLILFVMAALLIPLAVGGQMGSIHYPLLILHKEGFSYIPIYQYMMKHIYLFLVVSFFSFCLVLLFSTLLKQRFFTIVSSLLAIIGAVILTEQIEWLQSAFNPFFYYRFGELIERTEQLGHISFSLVVIGYSLLLLAVSYLVEAKGLSIKTGEVRLPPFRKGEMVKAKRQSWGLLLFEIRKLRRQKGMKQTLLLLFIVILAGFFMLNYSAEQKQVKHMETLEKALSEYEVLFAKYEELIDDTERTLKKLNAVDQLTDEQKTSMTMLESLLKSYRSTVKNYYSMRNETLEEIKAFNNRDWPTYYNFWIDRNLIFAGKKYVGYSVTDLTPTERGGISDFTNKTSVAEKELLAERQLQPVFNFEYVSTIHDRFPNPMDKLEWNRRTLKTDSTGLFYSYIFYNSNLYLLLLGILVMLFGVGFSEEKGKKRTLALLATQPLPKNTMYLSKAMTFVAVGFLTALSTLLLIVSAGTIGNRFGDWNFPVLFYDAEDVVQSANYTGIVAEEGGFHFINMGRYVVEASVLFLVAILFVLALAFLVSLFVNNTMASLLVSAIILVGGAVLSASSPFASVAHLSPFTYLNVAKIPNGELATLSNNVSITMNVGVWVLLAGMVVMIGMGLWRFRRMKLM